MHAPSFPARPRVLAALAVPALALALAACGSQAADPATTPSSSGEPVAGGELTFAIGNDPISLNPSGTGSGNDTWYVTRQLVDSLLWQDPADGTLRPWLASEWTANADATSFTFTLRDDVTFSDGTPLTAQSVKSTFDDAVAAGALSQAAPLLAGYQQSVVVDEHTVEVRFSRPNAAFPQAASSVTLGILGEATFAVPFADRASGQAVVASGPFVLDHYTKDVETVLTAREDYAWGPDGRKNTGAAYLDGVTFQVLPEAGVRTGSLTSEQVDVAGGIAPSDVPGVRDAGLGLVTRANPGIVFGLSFNGASTLGADPAVREAVALAIDREVVRDTALTEDFAVATSVLSHTTPGAADLSEDITTDADAAAEVLEDAGWVREGDGLFTKDGTPLELEVVWISNFGPNQTSLELVQQQLKDVGIGVNLWSGTVPEFTERLKVGQFDAAWGNLSRADGDVLRTQYSSAATNYYRVEDPELEALLQEQLTVADPEARTAVVREVQERLLATHAQVPVHELTTIVGTLTDVHGVELGADSRLDQLTSAWLDR